MIISGYEHIVNAINKLRLPVPICTEMTQSSDVQGNINKIIIVKVKFILTFTINYSFILNYSSWSKKNLSNHIITYFKKFFRFHLKSEARV